MKMNRKVILKKQGLDINNINDKQYQNKNFRPPSEIMASKLPPGLLSTNSYMPYNIKENPKKMPYKTSLNVEVPATVPFSSWGIQSEYPNGQVLKRLKGEK